MKKGIVLLLFSLMFFNLVSAVYICSNETIKEQDEVILIGDIEYINGLDMALVDSNPGFSGDLFVDADRHKIDNQNLTIDFSLLSGDYTLELLNTTYDGNVWLRSGGEEVEAKLKIPVKVGEVNVFLTSISGEYPGDSIEIKLFVGTEHLFLYKSNPTHLMTLDGKDFRIALISTSGEGIRVEVKRCDESELIDVDESELEELNNASMNDSSINETNIDNSSINETIETNVSENTSSSDVVENESTTTENLPSDDSEGLTTEAFFEYTTDFLKENYIHVIIAIFIISLIIIALIFRRNKLEQKELKEVLAIKKRMES